MINNFKKKKLFTKNLFLHVNFINFFYFYFLHSTNKKYFYYETSNSP